MLRRNSQAGPAGEATPRTESHISQEHLQKDPIIVSVYNQKGGIGKTTATFNMGLVLSKDLNKRVLMVDADPQASLTYLVRGEDWDDSQQEKFYTECENKKLKGSFVTLADIFAETMDELNPKATSLERVAGIELSSVHEEYKNLFIIPGNLEVGNLEQPASLGIAGIGFYKAVPPSFMKVIREFAKQHDIDIVLVDLGPSVAAWNQCMIMYSDYFCVPFLTDFLSKKAMDNFLKKATQKWLHDFTDKLKLEALPKFLGAFPQRTQVRKKLDEAEKGPVQAFNNWMVKAYKSISEILPSLKEAGFITEDFKFSTLLGIPEFYSLGLDVQQSGRPISDVDFAHRHASGEGKPRTLNTSEKERKRAINFAFQKVLATLFLNMSAKHKAQLGTEFIRRIGFASLLRDELPLRGQELIDINPAATPRYMPEEEDAAQFFYENEHIDALLKHYLKTNRAAISLTAMQGDQAFAGRGQLAENLRDRIDQQKSNYRAYYIPINLGQNHWVIVIMEVSLGGKEIEYQYFDPLGEGVPKSLRDILSGVASRKQMSCNFKDYGDRLQYDGVNCGPWIVEYARALSNDNHIFPPQDINDSRKEHVDLLRSLDISVPGEEMSAGASPKHKKGKATQKRMQAGAESAVAEEEFSEESLPVTKRSAHSGIGATDSFWQKDRRFAAQQAEERIAKTYDNEREELESRVSSSQAKFK